MSYGPNFPDLFRGAAEMVDKFCAATKPGDIPVEQPTKFEFVINLTTAKSAGPHDSCIVTLARRRTDGIVAFFAAVHFVRRLALNRRPRHG